MKIVQCKNGDEVEIALSGNGSNPDARGGQHTNMSTVWVRLKDGEWILSRSKSHTQTLRDAEAAESFVALLQQWGCLAEQPAQA